MKQDNQISTMLEKELRKNPKTATSLLREKAAEIKKAVGKLDLRSFHGTYVGAIKRKISGKKGGRKKGATVKKSTGRTQMTSDLSASINSLIDKQIRDARASLDKTLDAELKKARKLNKIEDFQKILDVLKKAEGML